MASRNARETSAATPKSAARYLRYAPDPEALRVFYSEELKEPHTHGVWLGDFMGMCKHDIACHVCFSTWAVITTTDALGKQPWSVQPCWECQAKGFELRRKPWWQRLFLRAAQVPQPIRDTAKPSGEAA